MRVTYNGRCVQINGKAGEHGGDMPRKPVRWHGTFLVADSAGNAEQAEWKPGSGPLMTYLQAREMAFRLMDELGERIEAAHGLPIKKVAFTLMSR